MFYRLRKTLNARRLAWQLRGVLATPPLRLVDSDLTFVSKCQASDLNAYLLAIKSIYRRIGHGRVVVILAPEEDEAFRATLRVHIPGVELIETTAIDTAPCQPGGTWERLLHCLRLAQTRYVIQVDADLLAYGSDLAAVAQAVADNRCFLLGGYDTTPLMTAAEVAADARAMNHPYVGHACEEALEHAHGFEQAVYLRGSSGFCGYARGAIDPASVVRLHQAMEPLVGARWFEWGTEQFASNVAIANSANPMVLPYPDYSNHVPPFANHGRSADTVVGSLLHFIGSHRQDGGLYAALGQREIARLRAG
jgi:hypothetical protein